MNAGERAEVYLQRTIGDTKPRVAMSAPADGDGNAVSPGEIQAAPHVVDVRAARHCKRMAIVGLIPNLPRVVIAERPIAKKTPMHALSKIVEIGSRSDRVVAIRPAGMRTGTQRNDTSGGETSMHKIAAGPVRLVNTVARQWLILGPSGSIDRTLL